MNFTITNPAPTIATISPNGVVAGGAAFTLTVDGTNFVPASMVNFGGTAATTNYVNSMRLTATIPAAAIASVGTAAVTVGNPAPGGGNSNAVNFTITSGAGPNPIPTINFLSPGWSQGGTGPESVRKRATVGERPKFCGQLCRAVERVRPAHIVF
jgi:hypothetical protein